MTNDPNDGICQETSGFLFSHRCDRIAVKACVKCSKAVCQDHGHEVLDGTVCTTCLKKQTEAQPPNPENLPGTPGSPTTANLPSRPGVAANPNVHTSNYTTRPYYNDPYFYGPYYYPGYGYGVGYSTGRSSFHVSRSGGESASSSTHDPHDFTEGDAESLKKEGDEKFEAEMGES